MTDEMKQVMEALNELIAEGLVETVVDSSTDTIKYRLVEQ